MARPSSEGSLPLYATYASWLNQVEIWLSILQTKSLRGASFWSALQLCEHIEAFIDAYNENAQPFEWRKVKSRVGMQSRLILFPSRNDSHLLSR
jgi:hypothetical protein